MREPERAVHERLDVADAQERIASLRGDPVGQALGRQRLPDAQRQLAGVAQRGEQLGRAAPAVLVVDAGDAGRGGRRQRLAHRGERLGPARLGIGVVELPGRLLAQDAGRLAGRVALDDAARHRPVASVVSSAAELSHSECPSCARSAIFAPGAIASSAWRVGFSLHSSSRQPRPRSQPPGLHLGRGHALERLGERGAAEQPQLPPAERPAREVHVRVDQARHDARAADVDPP